MRVFTWGVRGEKRWRGEYIQEAVHGNTNSDEVEWWGKSNKEHTRDHV